MQNPSIHSRTMRGHRNSEQSRYPRIKISVLHILYLSLIVFLLIVWILRAIFHPYIVSGNSMLPTYKNGDIITTTVYQGEDLHKGDIVIFRTDSGTLIKRIVALSGETVHIVQGNLYVNETLVEDGMEAMQYAGTAEQPYTIPENHVFVLGDNRNNSKDSRYIGAIPMEDIKYIVRK